jgi:MerR family transcriptional regulator, copper efflux regulator
VGEAMLIGELATQAGVNPQTLRYYERRKLLRPLHRATSGFREYDDASVRQVRFIRRAQDLGFTLEEIRDLLTLWADSEKSCGAVEQRSRATLGRIEEKIADLEQMRAALTKYVSACKGRMALDQCPLLAELGEVKDAESDEQRAD